MTDPHRVRSTRPPQPRQVVQKTLKYSEGQEHLLRRLAGAIVLQWDELPDELQDLIIDQAAVVVRAEMPGNPQLAAFVTAREGAPAAAVPAANSRRETGKAASKTGNEIEFD